jgi:hypothetical protein
VKGVDPEYRNAVGWLARGAALEHPVDSDPSEQAGEPGGRAGA